MAQKLKVFLYIFIGWFQTTSFQTFKPTTQGVILLKLLGISIRFVVLFLKIPGPLLGLIIGILLLCQVLTCTVLGATDTCAVFHSVCGTVSISSLMAALMVSMPLGWDTLNNIIRWTLIYLCYGSWWGELNLLGCPQACVTIYN